MKDILSILEKGTKWSSIIDYRRRFEGEVIGYLSGKTNRGTPKKVVAAVKAPGFGDRRKEMLQDIAIPDRWYRYQRRYGHKLEGADIASLGQAASVTIDKDNTTIVGGKGKRQIL